MTTALVPPSSPAAPVAGLVACVLVSLLAGLAAPRMASAQDHQWSLGAYLASAGYSSLTDTTDPGVLLEPGTFQGLHGELWFGRWGARVHVGGGSAAVDGEPATVFGILAGDVDLMARLRWPRPGLFFQPYGLLGFGALRYELEQSTPTVGGYTYESDPTTRGTLVLGIGADFGGGPVAVRLELTDIIGTSSPLSRPDSGTFGAVSHVVLTLGVGIRTGRIDLPDRPQRHYRPPAQRPRPRADTVRAPDSTATDSVPDRPVQVDTIDTLVPVDSAEAPPPQPTPPPVDTTATVDTTPQPPQGPPPQPPDTTPRTPVPPVDTADAPVDTTRPPVRPPPVDTTRRPRTDTTRIPPPVDTTRGPRPGDTTPAMPPPMPPPVDTTATVDTTAPTDTTDAGGGDDEDVQGRLFAVRVAWDPDSARDAAAEASLVRTLEDAGVPVEPAEPADDDGVAHRRVGALRNAADARTLGNHIEAEYGLAWEWVHIPMDEEVPAEDVEASTDFVDGLSEGPGEGGRGGPPGGDPAGDHPPGGGRLGASPGPRG